MNALILSLLLPTLVPDVVPQVGHDVRAFEVSDDGRFVLTAGGNTLKLWDTDSGRLVRTMPGMVRDVVALAISKDGRYLAGASMNDEGTNGFVEVFQSKDGARLWSRELGTTQARALRFTASGLLVEVGAVTQVRALKSGELTGTCLGSGADQLGRALVVVNGRALLRCDPSRGNAKTLATFDDDVTGARSFGERVLVAGKKDTYVVEKGTPRALGVKGRVHVRGDQAVVVTDGGLTVLDNKGQKASAIALTPFSGDARLLGPVVLERRDNRVLMRDAASGETLRAIEGTRSPPVSGLDVSPNGKWLLTSRGHLFDLSLARLERTLDPGIAVRFVDDKVALIGSKDKLKLVDVHSGDVLATRDVANLIDLQLDDAHRRALVVVGGQGAFVFEIAPDALSEPVSAVKDKTIMSARFSDDPNEIVVGVSGVFTAGAFVVSLKAARVNKTRSGIERDRQVAQSAFMLDKMSLSPSGRFLAVGGDRTQPLVHRGLTGRPYFSPRGHQARITGLSFHPRRALLASTSDDGTVRVVDVDKKRELVSFALSDAGRALAWSRDGRLLFVGSADGAVHVFEPGKKTRAATLVASADGAFAIFAGNSSYTASRGATELVAFRADKRVLGFSQFDLRFNKPHDVVKALGVSSARTLKLYRAAYEKRVARSGIKLSGKLDDLSLPTVKLAKLPALVEAESVELNVSASGKALRSLSVVVGGVPLSSTGILVEGDKVEKKIKVALAPGDNNIEVIATDARGASSLRASTRVTRKAEESARLFVLAAGVSTYKETDLNLKYAAKDATDVVAALKASNPGRELKSMILTDAQVSKEKLLEARSFVEQADVDDVVIFFVAGHGFLDENYNYFYATHETVPASAAKTGVSFAELEGLLDGISSRKKLLLMDTCFSGELDDDDVRTGEVASGVQVHPSGARALVLKTRLRVTSRERSAALQSLFTDLRVGSGTHIVSSSGGAEFSLELDDLENGAFTAAFLEGIQAGVADTDKSGEVSVVEARDYTLKRVRELTGGRQQPTVRREVLANRFEVAKAGSAKVAAVTVKKSGEKARGAGAVSKDDTKDSKTDDPKDNKDNEDTKIAKATDEPPKKTDVVEVRDDDDDGPPYGIPFVDLDVFAGGAVNPWRTSIAASADNAAGSQQLSIEPHLAVGARLGTSLKFGDRDLYLSLKPEVNAGFLYSFGFAHTFAGVDPSGYTGGLRVPFKFGVELGGLRIEADSYSGADWAPASVWQVSELDGCRECGGLALPVGVTRHGFSTVRHYTDTGARLAYAFDEDDDGTFIQLGYRLLWEHRDAGPEAGDPSGYLGLVNFSVFTRPGNLDVGATSLDALGHRGEARLVLGGGFVDAAASLVNNGPRDLIPISTHIGLTGELFEDLETTAKVGYASQDVVNDAAGLKNIVGGLTFRSPFLAFGVQRTLTWHPTQAFASVNEAFVSGFRVFSIELSGAAGVLEYGAPLDAGQLSIARTLPFELGWRADARYRLDLGRFPVVVGASTDGVLSDATKAGAVGPVLEGSPMSYARVMLTVGAAL